MYTPITKKEREAEERKRSLNQLKNNDMTLMNATPNNLFHVEVKEKSPLLPKDLGISHTYGTHENSKKLKMEMNRKRKQSIDDDDDEESSKDWWTKYFASLEEMIHENMEAKKHQIQDGSLIHLSDEMNAIQKSVSCHSNEKSPGEHKRKFGFKTAGNAVKFAARISPKSVRKRIKSKTALCKVNIIFLLILLPIYV